MPNHDPDDVEVVTVDDADSNDDAVSAEALAGASLKQMRQSPTA